MTQHLISYCSLNTGELLEVRPEVVQGQQEVPPSLVTPLPEEAAEPSGGCAAVYLEAVDAGVFLVPPIVVNLQLHVTEGVLAGVLGKGQEEHVRNPEEA